MIVRVCRVACLCLCCLIAGSTASWAQESHLDAPGEIPKYVRDPIPLYTTGLGPFHRPITTKNKEAQAFFDQGFQMMYAFARLDAVRSFREAWKRDPDCAICYWGEGWAWGSYLNGPMSAEQSPFAYAATQKAISMKDKASPKERAFIDALSVRYVKDFDVKTRKEQDQAYADAMAKVAEEISRRSRCHHALRRRAVPARTAARHARRQRAEHQAAARRARVGAEDRSEASRRLPSLRARHRVHGAARPRGELRASISARPFPAPATSTTCRRTPGTKSAAGAIRCRPTPTRGIRT